jgi:hypothetical protein
MADEAREYEIRVGGNWEEEIAEPRHFARRL